MEDAQAALNIVWPRMSYHVAAEIEAFLSKQYRHHESDVEAVLENPRLSDWLRGAYEVLDGWVSTGENSQHFAALDRIRADFNCSAPAFARLVAAAKSAARKVTQAHRTLAEAQAKLIKSEKARAAAQETAARLQAELREVRRQLRQSERQIERVKAAKTGTHGQTKDCQRAAAEHDNGTRAGAGLQVAVTPAVVK